MVAARPVEMPEMTKQTSAMSQITPLPIMAPTSAGLVANDHTSEMPFEVSPEGGVHDAQYIGPCDDKSRTPSMRQCVLVDRAILHDDQKVSVRICHELNVL